MKKRYSGVLMPIFSLPSPYGIGNFGKAAYDFVDFLDRTKQRYWQVLPLGPLTYGDSPYQSYSAFAGNPYFIDIDTLVAEGYLADEDVKSLRDIADSNWVDYAWLYDYYPQVLGKAVTTFLEKADTSDYDKFVAEASWLPDYALFMALKSHFDDRAWVDWPDEAVRRREESSLAIYREELKDQITYHQVIQYFFAKQWEELKGYANQRGVGIIGDMPIYVSADSCDMWVAPQYFKTNEAGLPSVVAGYPPDAFSDTGQLWGNPLYDWEAMQADDFAWWKARMAQLLNLYDVVRIDHFIGFSAFWEIPAGDETARNGRWVEAPGQELFTTLKNHMGNLPIIAEDLGLVTDRVRDLLSATGFPGMKILHFAFDLNGDSSYMPHNAEPNSVIYTGTHDHNTSKGWYDKEISDEVRQFVDDYSNRRPDESPTRALIRLAWSAPSNLAITTMADLLELDSQARLNSPGTLGQNWQWRMAADAITPELENWLTKLTHTYRRCRK